MVQPSEIDVDRLRTDIDNLTAKNVTVQLETPGTSRIIALPLNPTGKSCVLLHRLLHSCVSLPVALVPMRRSDIQYHHYHQYHQYHPYTHTLR